MVNLLKKNQLEKARESVSQDLSEMSDMLQQELKRHKAQQDKELKLILIAFAKIHLSYCERVSLNGKVNILFYLFLI